MIPNDNSIMLSFYGFFKPLNPKEVLAKVEELRKKYNIPKENMIAERSTLRFLFLSERDDDESAT